MNLVIKYQRVIDRLPILVKFAVLTVIFGVIFIFWYYGFWQNVQDSISISSDKIAGLEKSASKLEKQFKAIESNIEFSTKGLSSISQLITSKQSIKMLNDLLAASNSLSLLQLKNTPTKEVKLPSSDIRIFEHGVEMVFMADYFSTMKYLELIEKLNWKIFWDKLEYEVVAYPNAKVTLRLHTVNDDDS